MIVFSISGDEDTCQNSNFDTTELDDDSGMYFDHLFRIYFFFFFFENVIQLTFTKIFVYVRVQHTQKIKVMVITFLSLEKISYFCDYKVKLVHGQLMFLRTMVERK